MNCCNKGFTPFWRKAAIVKQQLKNQRKRMAERGTSILKKTGGIPYGPPADRTFSLLIMRIT